MVEKPLETKDMTERLVQIRAAHNLASNREIAEAMLRRRGTGARPFPIAFEADGFRCACLCNVAAPVPSSLVSQQRLLKSGHVVSESLVVDLRCLFCS